jgi:hypothetical protein
VRRFIGLDLWIKSWNPVLAALEGTIHSLFKKQYGFGRLWSSDYLEHEIDGLRFYTFILTFKSREFDEKTEGAAKRRNRCQLGVAPINGDYAPCLHFQIIKDMQGKGVIIRVFVHELEFIKRIVLTQICC